MKRDKTALLNPSGFTLLEITIIIIIIGLLAATLTVQFINLSDSAKIAKCRANQGALQNACTSFWAQTMEYPEIIDDLAPYMATGVIPECPSGGSYIIVNESIITCSLPEHQ